MLFSISRIFAPLSNRTTCRPRSNPFVLNAAIESLSAPLIPLRFCKDLAKEVSGNVSIKSRTMFSLRAACSVLSETFSAIIFNASPTKVLLGAF